MKLKLLPSETFTVETQDSIEVVRQKLLAQVKDHNQIESSENYLFKNQVSDYEFSISLMNKKYFTYYISIIVGRFENIQNRVNVNVKMRMDYKEYPLRLVFF